jgi:hypothetical protein
MDRLLEKDVCLGHVAEDERDLGPVRRVGEHLVDYLQHRRDARAAWSGPAARLRLGAVVRVSG